MRVSARINDCGFVANRAGILITLDGVNVRDCVLADDQAGIVVVRVRDNNGVLVSENGDRLREVTRRGVVCIVGLGSSHPV
jgi:hypothetical protein